MNPLFFMSMDLDDLTKLANYYQTDKGNSHKYGHCYTYFYDLILNPKRNEPLKFVEIGVSQGSSIKMWRDYFSKAKLYGLDIEESSLHKIKNLDNVVGLNVNQENRKELLGFAEEHGPFDIILDDGGHTQKQQQTSFASLFSYLVPGGFYIIEDLQGPYGGYFNNQSEKPDDDIFVALESLGVHGTLGSSVYYMEDDEIDYIEDNFEFVKLFSGCWGELWEGKEGNPKHGGKKLNASWTSVIKKKELDDE